VNCIGRRRVTCRDHTIAGWAWLPKEHAAHVFGSPALSRCPGRHLMCLKLELGLSALTVSRTRVGRGLRYFPTSCAPHILSHVELCRQPMKNMLTMIRVFALTAAATHRLDELNRSRITYGTQQKWSLGRDKSGLMLDRWAS
jgi:hypothetical protein